MADGYSPVKRPYEGDWGGPMRPPKDPRPPGVDEYNTSQNSSWTNPNADRSSWAPPPQTGMDRGGWPSQPRDSDRSAWPPYQDPAQRGWADGPREAWGERPYPDTPSQGPWSGSFPPYNRYDYYGAPPPPGWGDFASRGGYQSRPPPSSSAPTGPFAKPKDDANVDFTDDYAAFYGKSKHCFNRRFAMLL